MSQTSTHLPLGYTTNVNDNHRIRYCNLLVVAASRRLSTLPTSLNRVNLSASKFYNHQLCIHALKMNK